MAGGDDDRSKLFQSPVKLVIDDQIVILVTMFNVAHGLAQAPTHTVGVIAPLEQTLFQRIQGRRQDKDTDGIVQPRSDLLRALPVYLQDHVLALGELLLHPVARGGITVVEYGGVFEEPVLLQQGIEFLFTDEIVVNFMPLVRSRGAGGMGDGHQQLGQGGDQPAYQRGLPGAGRRGDDEQGAGACSGL